MQELDSHADGIVDCMHLRMHGSRLSPELDRVSVVVGSVMIMARAYDFATFDKDGTKMEAHD